MKDAILESIFLDTHLWTEVIEHGCLKGIPTDVLLYLQSPVGRAEVCGQIEDGEYAVSPPHTGYRMKDDGGERVFFANEPLDRLVLNVIYKWLIRNEKQMTHPHCRSYQEGIGVGQIVKNVAYYLNKYSQDTNGVIGCKFDIHKYFESVGREHIHRALDSVESHYGKSAIIDLLRKYYNSDIYYDSRKKQLVEQYQGIKQGCAVSAWLANVILYPLDDKLSRIDGFYCRYSDDIIYVGPHSAKVTDIIRQELNGMGLKLNEKKIEHIRPDKFVRFLGYYIRGNEITLSPKWVKKFQQNIESITVHNRKLIQQVRNLRREQAGDMEERLMRIVKRAAKKLAISLYAGSRYSWASLTLGVINREEDIKQLNLYCLDALRAVYTGKTNIGGLGVSKENGIQRGKGRNVKANRMTTNHIIRNVGYLSLTAMHNIRHNKWLFLAVANDLIFGQAKEKYQCNKTAAKGGIDIESLEKLYEEYCYSRPNAKRIERYYAKHIEELTMKDMIRGKSRNETLEQMESWLSNNISYHNFPAGKGMWYWQSSAYPQLVLLRQWFENI